MYVIKVVGTKNFPTKIYWNGKERKVPFTIVCESEEDKNRAVAELENMGCEYIVEEVFRNEYVEVKGNEVRIVENYNIEDVPRRRRKEDKDE